MHEYFPSIKIAICFSCCCCQRPRPVPRETQRSTSEEPILETCGKVKRTTPKTEWGATLPASSHYLHDTQPEKITTRPKQEPQQKGQRAGHGEPKRQRITWPDVATAVLSNSLHVTNPKQPASEQLRARLCDATKRMLNEVKRLFVLLLPDITAGPT